MSEQLQLVPVGVLRLTVAAPSTRLLTWKLMRIPPTMMFLSGASAITWNTMGAWCAAPWNLPAVSSAT